MAYTLLYTKTAVKDIKKLDKVVKRKIKIKIGAYSQNPITQAKKLTDFSLGSYRWRIGNHRIIFDLDKKNIVILRVGHRKEVYK